MLASPKVETIREPGFTSVELDQDIYLEEGDTFSIVYTLTGAADIGVIVGFEVSYKADGFMDYQARN